MTRSVQKLDAHPLPNENKLTLVKQSLGLDGRKQRGEAAVERRGVHVSEAARARHAGVGLLGERSFRSRNEHLLNVLVGERGSVRHGEERVGLGDVGESGSLGVCHEVTEGHARMALDSLLAIGAVEDGVVDIFK